MDILIEKYRTLLQHIPLKFIRGLEKEINWDARAICIEGARGTGKSTLMLQHIKKALPLDETIYISLDDLYFKEHTFSEVADTFYKHGGRYLFADEVHKYQGWQQEVKNIYDFYPDLHIVVSGSSILALQKSQVDLSRRLLRYSLPELSLREFIVLEKDIELPVITLEKLLSVPNEIVDKMKEKIPSPLKLFNAYLKYGAYPFFLEGKSDLSIRLNQLINVIIDYDLLEAQSLETATLNKLKKLLYILSTVVPFQPNISKLSVQVNTSRTRLLEMLHLLEKAQLLHLLRANTHGISLMNKPEKIFLHNTALITALAEQSPNVGNLRETFFLSQMRNAGYTLTYPKKGDFWVDKTYLFEIGGKNKSKKQIAGEENAFVAADNIEYATYHQLPLWLFGFLY